MGTERVTLHVGGHDVSLSNPDKVVFPRLGVTKRMLAAYYVDVADAALRAIRGRPMILKRFVHGVEAEGFFQKRAPKGLPPYIETATFRYRSGMSADEVVVREAAGLVWLVSLGCVDLHVHPVRADDLDRPDELRIDLDPVAGVPWHDVVEVARVTGEVLREHGLVGWPKTSGSRGIHIWVRIERRWRYEEVRRAALALAHEVERRAPGFATATWQKTERHGVLVDYNQNARDRTTASAWSVRPTPDARVSMPLRWEALATCDPAAFTLATVPALYAAHGDPHAGIDDAVGSLEPLLALADADEGPAKARKKAAMKKKRAEDAPVLVVARAKAKADALDGLARWKAAHPDVAVKLAPDDILIDAMRGRSSAWYRVRVHMRNVPPALRPPQGTPDPDYDAIAAGDHGPIRRRG